MTTWVVLFTPRGQPWRIRRKIPIADTRVPRGLHQHVLRRWGPLDDKAIFEPRSLGPSQFIEWDEELDE